MTFEIAPERGGEGDTVTLSREIELGGGHTVFLYSDGSLDVVDFENRRYLAENAVSLGKEETYKLYLSLHEMFKDAAQAGE